MPDDDPYIVAELTGVHEQLDRERAMTEGAGFFAPLKELLFLPDMRYRLLLAFGLGAAGQWLVHLLFSKYDGFELTYHCQGRWWRIYSICPGTIPACRYYWKHWPLHHRHLRYRQGK